VRGCRRAAVRQVDRRERRWQIRGRQQRQVADVLYIHTLCYAARGSLRASEKVNFSFFGAVHLVALLRFVYMYTGQCGAARPPFAGKPRQLKRTHSKLVATRGDCEEYTQS